MRSVSEIEEALALMKYWPIREAKAIKALKWVLEPEGSKTKVEDVAGKGEEG